MDFKGRPNRPLVNPLSTKSWPIYLPFKRKWNIGLISKQIFFCFIGKVNTNQFNLLGITTTDVIWFSSIIAILRRTSIKHQLQNLITANGNKTVPILQNQTQFIEYCTCSLLLCKTTSSGKLDFINGVDLISPWKLQMRNENMDER